MIKKCLNCSKEFKTYPSRTKIGKGLFCSKKCWREYHCLKLICRNCKKEYLYPKSQTKVNFCSKSCMEEYRKKNKVERKCLKCGKKFVVYKHRLKEKRGKYCSPKCYWESLLIPPELKRKHQVEYTRKYRREHPEKAASWKHKRRALQKKAGGHFTAEEWKLLKEKFHYKCANCGQEKKLTVDHIIPLCKWFEWKKKHNPQYKWNDIQNIQPLCSNCNSQKSWFIK